MLNIYLPAAQGLQRMEPAEPATIPAEAVWLDLLEPTPQEEQLVEAALGIEIPTREEMKEIETSNRLYEENGALYMTTTVAAHLDTDRPILTAVSFILTGNRLVTNRYIDTKSFQQYSAYATKHQGAGQSAVTVLVGIMEALIERIADVLERIGADLDGISSNIFARHRNAKAASDDLRSVIERIGFHGELNSKARESLVSLGRLLMFVQQSAAGLQPEQREHLHSISRDVLSLSDHASFLGTKVSFLLEATLGLINLEQNNIIKIFSVAAVLFLPPTLIASIYGMNFHVMPELDWALGYPFALLLMVASMGVTYVMFKRKGWL